MSGWGDGDDQMTYKVVVNHERQYSIWPEQKENPLGWEDAGKWGTKAECLAWIEQLQIDTRPMSLRKKTEEELRRQMEEQARPPKE